MNDDDDVLVALAFDGAEVPDDISLARARRLLRTPDGLARAYRVLDDAGAICAATGVDPGGIAGSPLAGLLADAAAQATTTRSPLLARALGPAMPLLAAAAALGLFILVDAPGGPDASVSVGTKGASLTGQPQVVVSVREARGPLGAAGVVAGLEPRAGDIARCSDRDVVVDVRFRVGGDGLVVRVAGHTADPAADDGVAACVAGVVQGTAFALHDDATDVDARVELHPSAGGAP